MNNSAAHSQWREILAVLQDHISKSQDALETFYDPGNPDRSLKKAAARQHRIADHEAKLTGEADAACYAFARDQSLPQLSAECALLVFYRMVEARRFVQFALGMFEEHDIPGAIELPCPKDTGIQRMLELLLLEYWHFAGRHRWRLWASTQERSDDWPPSGPSSIFWHPPKD